MRPFVYDVFKMAGFIQIFDIHKTREEALAGLR
jgi:hypothetical protein